MTNQLQQLLAASALIMKCKTIVASDWLPEAEEQDLRILLAKCCKAYGMLSIAERTTPANDSSFDAQLILVSQALNAMPISAFQDHGSAAK